MSRIIMDYQLNFNSLWVLVLFSLIVVCPSSSPSKLCREEERTSLLQFKAHFSVNESSDYCSQPRTLSWKEGCEDCCGWDGVSCDNVSGHVIVLDLAYSCLYGVIPPNTTLFNLVRLQELYLGGNDFSSSHISPSFGLLINLKNLGLDDSKLSGVVPNELFQLPKLHMLDLSQNNRVTGKISSSLNATKLVHLDISSTSFMGKLPDSIGKLKSLQFLSFDECHFSGTIPAALGNLTNLDFLGLDNNQFTGNLPSSLSNLHNLTTLLVGHNNLQGSIPPSLFNLTKIKYLDLEENNLSGELPSKFSDLSDLYLSGNQVTGTIDLHMFTRLQSLENLDLSYNCLSVSTTNSSFLSPFPRINSLALSSCNISTNILAYLKVQKELWYLDLSKNKIANELHPSICNLQSLEYLDLSNNQLVGLIPTCLGKSTGSLSVLNLQNNNFHGTIPQSIGYAKGLVTLDLSNNGLQGVLPRSLVSCTLLEVLNLGGNMLTDSFPFWLVNLPTLKVLILRDNKFYGTITRKSKRKSNRLVNLHIIDLSRNNLSGTLSSKYFDDWNAMTIADKNASDSLYMLTSSNYYSYVNLMNKGQFMHYGRILTTLKVVDFSHNMFSGNISLSVGRLKGIQVLNFSRNAFTGPIPSSLGNLSNLESLDLSNNKLFGEIPQELSSLTFLEFLNVSQNNLTGVIPRGRQLDTFSNTSYEGNPGLCGLPLSRLCSNPDSPTSSTQKNHHSKFEIDDFGWEVVLIGYGCGLVLGLVIGCCIIRRKEDWLERTFRLKMRSMGKRSKNQRS